MSQMFLFNNLTEGREPLQAGVNPACTEPGHNPRKVMQALKRFRGDFPLGLRYTERKI